MASESVPDVVNDDAGSDSDSESFSAPPPPRKMMAMGSGEEEAGKGMGASKPFLGSMVPPSNVPANNASPPDLGLELEWVFGLRAFDSKSNVVSNARGEVVYPAAGLVVVLDSKAGTQRHYLGHNDDVRCLALNPADKNFVASGQSATIVNGRATAAYVCVWDTRDFKESFKLQLPVGSRACRAVAFSPCGRYVSAVADDDDHTISIWDWRAQKQVVETKADKNAILQIKWNHIRPSDTVYELVSVGVKSAYVWAFDSASSSLKGKRVALGGSFPMQTWNSLTFSEKGHAMLGGFDGTILVVKVDSKGVASKAIQASAAPPTAKVVPGAKAAPTAKVFSLDTYTGGIVAALSDKTVSIFDSKLTIVKSLKFSYKVTSVHVRGRDLLVGTQGGQVYEIPGALDAAVEGGPVEGRFEPLTNGHMEGELWALALSSKDRRAWTAGEDNQLLAWDLQNHRLLKRGVINPKKGTAPVVKKASTSSTFPQNQCARALALNPSETHLAAGTNDGSLTVFDATSLEPLVHVDLNAHSQRKVTNQEGNWIQTMSYSPNGHLLAVGTHGSAIVILDAQHKYKVLSVINSHHSFLTHMDWSAGGEFLRSNDGAYELLFHSLSNPAAPKQVVSATSLRDEVWASHTCVFCWTNVGVIKEGDGTFVNSVDATMQGGGAADKPLIVTADDEGKIGLYRWPANAPTNTHFNYNGHSSHVTSARFTADGQRVLSTGGHDKSLFVWKVGPYVPSKSGRTHTVAK